MNQEKSINQRYPRLIAVWILVFFLSLSSSIHASDPTQSGPSSPRLTPEKLGLNDLEKNLQAFLRVRASLDPTQETACWWTGTIYSRMPDERSKPLFQFEGFSVARVLRDDTGWKLLTREGGFYKDPDTGVILDTWLNPSTAETITVQHVWNDPVNQDLNLNNPRMNLKLPFTQINDRICWNVDAVLFFPSPVPKTLHPDSSNSDQYSGMELFQFFADLKDVADPAMKSVPSDFSWIRVGPYLPWMKMGNQPGELVYHCRGTKLRNGTDGLPDHIKNLIRDTHPEYFHAPETFTSPNASSWTEYLKTLVTPTPVPSESLFETLQDTPVPTETL